MKANIWHHRLELIHRVAARQGQGAEAELNSLQEEVERLHPGLFAIVELERLLYPVEITQVEDYRKRGYLIVNTDDGPHLAIHQNLYNTDLKIQHPFNRQDEVDRILEKLPDKFASVQTISTSLTEVDFV